MKMSVYPVIFISLLVFHSAVCREGASDDDFALVRPDTPICLPAKGVIIEVIDVVCCSILDHTNLHNTSDLLNAIKRVKPGKFLFSMFPVIVFGLTQAAIGLKNGWSN